MSAHARGPAGCLRSLLLGVGRTDPATYAAVSLFLAAVALVSTLYPARRAAKVDPAETLSVEG
jgi:hypothetical protein